MKSDISIKVEKGLLLNPKYEKHNKIERIPF
jgi:hypothetical protein